MNCSCSTLHPSSIVLMNHSRKLWKFDRKLTMWPLYYYTTGSTWKTELFHCQILSTNYKLGWKDNAIRETLIWEKKSWRRRVECTPLCTHIYGNIILKKTEKIACFFFKKNLSSNISQLSIYHTNCIKDFF